MAEWPGGNCPQCGEWMPPNMIHCRECRQLLNPELTKSSVEMPTFEPLQELDSMAEVEHAGFYCECPKCQRELKVAKKYLGERVQCKHCQAGLVLDPMSPIILRADVYAKCPHCEQQIRFDPKYMGMKVACRFCQGKLQVLKPS